MDANISASYRRAVAQFSRTECTWPPAGLGIRGLQVPAKGTWHSNLNRLDSVRSFRPGPRLDNLMQLLHGSYTLISPDRKGRSSRHLSSGFRYSVRSPGWAWGNAQYWRHLVKSTPPCSFWLGLLYSAPAREQRKSWAMQACFTLRRNSRACLQLRKPVGRDADSGALDRGWGQKEGPPVQPRSLHEPQGRES